MIEISYATDIEAPAKDIWRVLTDLPAFHAWNPFIRRARGSTELGGTVHVRVRPSLPVPLRFAAKIIENKPGSSLRWRGKFLSRWVAAGDHTFALEPIDGERTRFVQTERFTGILPWLASKLLVREAGRGFAKMNRALADRATMERT